MHTLHPVQNTSGYATPDIPPASTLANFYSIYDADGSLLGHHKRGFALANYQPLLPPASLQAEACEEREQWGPMWGCEGVCYRSPVLSFNESSPSEQVDGLPYRCVGAGLRTRWQASSLSRARHLVVRRSQAVQGVRSLRTS